MNEFWLSYGSYMGRRTLSVFLPYFYSRLKVLAKRTAYEAYVTDALKIIATNTGASTAMLGGPGSEIKVRYADLVSGKRETRTSAEIINGISAKLEGMAQT